MKDYKQSTTIAHPERASRALTALGHAPQAHTVVPYSIADLGIPGGIYNINATGQVTGRSNHE